MNLLFTIKSFLAEENNEHACLSSYVWFSMTPWTVAHQGSSVHVRFSRQEWRRFPFPSSRAEMDSLQLSPEKPLRNANITDYHKNSKSYSFLKLPVPLVARTCLDSTVLHFCLNFLCLLLAWSSLSMSFNVSVGRSGFICLFLLYINKSLWVIWLPYEVFSDESCTYVDCRFQDCLICWHCWKQCFLLLWDSLFFLCSVS